MLWLGDNKTRRLSDYWLCDGAAHFLNGYPIEHMYAHDGEEPNRHFMEQGYFAAWCCFSELKPKQAIDLLFTWLERERHRAAP